MTREIMAADAEAERSVAEGCESMMGGGALSGSRPLMTLTHTNENIYGRRAREK